MFSPHVTDDTSFNIHHIKSCGLLLYEVKESNCTDCQQGSHAIFDNAVARKSLFLNMSYTHTHIYILSLYVGDLIATAI